MIRVTENAYQEVGRDHTDYLTGTEEAIKRVIHIGQRLAAAVIPLPFFNLITHIGYQPTLQTQTNQPSSDLLF